MAQLGAWQTVEGGTAGGVAELCFPIWPCSGPGTNSVGGRTSVLSLEHSQSLGARLSAVEVKVAEGAIAKWRRISFPSGSRLNRQKTWSLAIGAGDDQCWALDCSGRGRSATRCRQRCARRRLSAGTSRWPNALSAIEQIL